MLELNDDEDDDGETSRDLEDDDGIDQKFEGRQPTPDETSGEVEFDKIAGSKSPTKSSSYSHARRVSRCECADGTADIACSTTDPWVYSTLSHDGVVVVHHVPSKEKYKILL